MDVPSSDALSAKRKLTPARIFAYSRNSVTWRTYGRAMRRVAAARRHLRLQVTEILHLAVELSCRLRYWRARWLRAHCSSVRKAHAYGHETGIAASNVHSYSVLPRKGAS